MSNPPQPADKTPQPSSDGAPPHPRTDGDVSADVHAAALTASLGGPAPSPEIEAEVRRRIEAADRQV